MEFVPPDLRVGESVFYWEEDPSNIQQGRTSGKWLKVEIIAVKGPMVVISTGASSFQVNVSTLRRPWDIEDLEKLLDSCERTGAPVLWLSCEGQIDVWELFSDNSYLCAILVRQGLLVAAPVDPRTKKAESFSSQLLQGFWSKLKKKNLKIVVMSPTVTTKNSQQMKVIWQQYRLCLAVAEYHILGGKHFLFLGPESGKIWWLKKVQYLQKKYHCQWTLLRGKQPRWILHNIVDLLQPLEFVPASRERVVPTEWQVRTVLEDCLSKAKVISSQAPLYRQYALVSDFLDLANLSIREKAALATNWIKDRTEALKLQNLAMATMKGSAVRSFLENTTADVQYAVNKCESLGSGKQLILHRESIVNCTGFFPAYGSPSTSFFLPNMHFQCCMILQGALGGNFDLFAASGESTAWVLLWRTRSRLIVVRICPVVQFNFFSTAFDPRAWTMVVFWKEDTGRQPLLITPENEGGDATN